MTHLTSRLLLVLPALVLFFGAWHRSLSSPAIK